MSGLLLAGLGQGVAAAGEAFTKPMMQRVMAREEEERMMRRAEMMDELKARREAATSKAEAEMYMDAEQAAIGAGKDRRFEKFKSDLGQTDMSEDELRKVYESQYDQKVVGNFEGADRYTERYSKLKEDILSELRKRGASGGLLTAAMKDRDATVSAERQAERDAAQRERDDRRLDIAQTNADANMARAEAAIAQSQAAIARAERSASKGGSDGLSAALSFVDNSRKALSSEATELRRLMEAEVDEARGPSAKQAVRAKYEAALQKIDERRREIDDYFDQLAPRVGLSSARPPAPAPSPVAPKGGQSIQPTSAAARPPIDSFFK